MHYLYLDKEIKFLKLKPGVAAVDCLPALPYPALPCLPDHSHMARDQTKQPIAIISHHNNKHLLVACSFLVPTRVCLLCFAFLFIFNYMIVFFFMQGNHTEAIISALNTFHRGATLYSHTYKMIAWTDHISIQSEHDTTP